MRKLLFLSALMMIALLSCKKNQEFKEEDGHTSEDNQNVQSNTDGAVSDANIAVSNNNLLAGKTMSAAQIAATSICGATVDTSLRAQGIVTINYDGVTACNNRKRSGSIKVTLVDYVNGKRWKDVGAVLQLDYTAYKVTRVSDSKSLTFDGTHTITNVTGGNWVLLVFALQPSLAVTVTGTNLDVTFDDGNHSTWNINRKYTYTYANAVLTCKGEGLGSQDGLSNLENWGTTREGDNFTSQVSTPIIWNSSCGANAPVEGQLIIRVAAKSFELTTTAAVDQSGNVVAPAANNCAYGFKVEWKYKKKTKTKIYKYL